MADQIKRWREAHQEIAITDAALTTAGPFPSLFASDFAVYVASRLGDAEDGAQIARFLKDFLREMTWVYDNWTKAQRDSDHGRLLLDLLNNATGPEYTFTAKFLRDYAAANNIAISDEKYRATWEELIQAEAKADVNGAASAVEARGAPA